MEKYEKLIGKIVTKVEIDSDRHGIAFTFKDGTSVKLACYGDCCSHTWVEDFDNPKALLGTIKTVEDIPMPEVDGDVSAYVDNPDVVRYYGVRFTTNKGVCVLDYRNDSNGYYGGDLEVY